MELLKHEVYSQAIENTYTINHPTEGILIYKEWIDSNDGKCLDFVLQSEDGYDIDDAELVEEVQMFIDGGEWEREMGR